MDGAHLETCHFIMEQRSQGIQIASHSLKAGGLEAAGLGTPRALGGIGKGG